MMKTTLVAAALLSLAGASFAKIPAPVLDDAAKAKAAEAAAKTAWQAKIDSYQLCKAQDRVVAMYKKTAAKSTATAAKGAASAPVVAAKAPTPVAPMPTTAGVPGTTGTPTVMTTAAAGTAAPCSDPGPFAYNQPSQTPLETSGAHSPAGTAKSPPSVRPEAAKIQPPAKKP
jgi:hypothetical protein